MSRDLDCEDGIDEERWERLMTAPARPRRRNPRPSAPTLTIPAITMAELITKRPEEWREIDAEGSRRIEIQRSGSPDVAPSPAACSDTAR